MCTKTGRMYGWGIEGGRRTTRGALGARIEGRPGWELWQDGGDYVCVVGLMVRCWQVWWWPW